MFNQIKNYLIKNSKFIQNGQEWDYYECDNLDSKQILFAQKINCSNLNKDDINNFINILNKIKNNQHENIINIFDILEEDQILYIITERFNYELKDYLKQQRKKFNEEEQKEIMDQISDGYLHLKKLKIIHGNIDLNSIVILKKNDQDPYKFKLNQFKSSQIQIKSNRNFIGLVFKAPEILSKSNQYQKEISDMFSFGIVLVELSSNTIKPSSIMSIEKLKEFHNILKQQVNIFQISEIMQMKIFSMLKFEPNSRLTWEELQNKKKQPNFNQLNNNNNDQLIQRNQIIQQDYVYQQQNYEIIKENFIDDDFEIYKDNVIGKGNQGIIFQAKLKRNNTDIVAKQVSGHKREMRREIEIFEILKNNKHDNVIYMYYKGQDKFKDYIFLEKCDMSLKDYMKNLNNDFQYIEFIRQITQGYLFLLKNDIIHRDIKPDNIMVKFLDGQVQYKLIDFGVGKQLDEDEITRTKAGTPIYQAPEVFQGQDHNHQCDVFSFGLVIFQIIFTQMPYKADCIEDIKVFHNQLKNNQYKFPKFQNGLFIDLIKKMLIYDQNQRIKWRDILNHQVFRNAICNFQTIQNNQMNHQNYQKSLTIYNLLYKYYLLGQKTGESLKKCQQLQTYNISKIDIDSMLLSIDQFCLFCLDTIYKFLLQDNQIINQYNFSIQREQFNEWVQNIKLFKTRQSMQEIIQQQYKDSDNLNSIHQCYQRYYNQQRQLFQNTNIDFQLRLYLERFDNLLTEYPINQNLNYSESNISIDKLNLDNEQQYLKERGFKI